MPSIQRRFLYWIGLLLCVAPACAAPPPTRPQGPLPAHRPQEGFRTQSLAATEPPLPQLEHVTQLPLNPAHELRFQTNPAVPNAIRMPAQGSFKVSFEAAGPNEQYAVLDNDATDDGLVRIRVPSQAYDIFLRPEQNSSPTICQGTGSTTPVLEQVEQAILDKANALIAQGKPHCVVLPPISQRQNTNCNSTSSGLSCSGALNKTIQKAQCPEIAGLVGTVNLNNDLGSSKLYLAASNSMTLNQSAQGLLATRGSLNTNLNGNRQLNGVFVGGSSNNLSLSGTPVFKGLYHIANQGSLSFNLNGNATFEGALCTTGNVNFNRNGNTKVIYHPNSLSPWLQDLPNLSALLCDARPNFYTQTLPPTCPAPSQASLTLRDPLYQLTQTIGPMTDGSWYKLPGRGLPVPADWYSADGAKYVLTLENQGMTQLTASLFTPPTRVVLPQSVRVIPQVHCVKPTRTGMHTVYLGYANQMPGPVTLPASFNRFEPEAANTGQAMRFEAGESPAYPQSPFAVSFSGEQFTWHLGDRTVSVLANDISHWCPFEAVPVSGDTVVRKNLLPAQTLAVPEGTASSHTTQFQLPEASDLKRRVLVSVINGPPGFARVAQASVLINGQKLPLDLNADISDNVAETFSAHFGANQLEVQLQGPPGSAVQVLVEGLMDPVLIPGAMNSKIMDDSVVRAIPHEKHLVGIKFMEGMKVRYDHSNRQFTDLTGISLRPLNQLLATLDLNSVSLAVPGTVEEHEQSEVRTAAFFGKESINPSLLYQLEFVNETDVWAMVDQLRKMPFLEEAFPTFFPNLAADQFGTPQDYLTNKSPQDQWLRNIRVKHDPFLASELGQKPNGSWAYTHGSPNVKIAVLDYGFQVENTETGVRTTHEDFIDAQGQVRIETINNLKAEGFPPDGYASFGHGNSAIGLIAARGDNQADPAHNGWSVGVAGIAYEAKAIGVQAYGRKRGPNYSSDPNDTIDVGTKCPNTIYGEPRLYCGATEQALALLKQKHPDIKIISFEIWQDPGTIESFAPIIRAMIADYTSQGITMMVPAGNQTCSYRSDADKPACEQRYSNQLPFKPKYGWDISKQYISAWIPFAGLTEIVAPWPDYGSIIVGAVNLGGTSKMGATYAHGISIPTKSNSDIRDCTSPDALYTKTSLDASNPQDDGGHGTDISAPAEALWTTGAHPTDFSVTNAYSPYGGTSGATPIVAGVVAQMLSVNSNLKPLEIRRILRCPVQHQSGQQSLAQKSINPEYHIAGMINAYEAVKAAKGGAPPPSPPPSNGDFSKQNITGPPANAPADTDNWLRPDSHETRVFAEGFIGIGISNQDLQDIEILIDGRPQRLLEIAENYVKVGLLPDLAPGVKDVIINLAGGSVTLERALEVFALPAVELVQSVPTIGAADVNGFSVGGNTYLAFANHSDGNFNHSLDIMRWNGSFFDPFQVIQTAGVQDSIAFTIGTESYLAVANYYDNNTTNLDSKIYRWNGTQFVDFQSLPTHGAKSFEYFEINGQPWLAVANSYPLPTQNSTLYQWDGSQFVPAQYIQTMGAADWEHVQIGSDHYLAVANSRNTEGMDGNGGYGNINSVLYKWNGATFEPYQDFATQYALDWESFKIGDETYLVVANFQPTPTLGDTYSRIYRWDGSQFVTFQSIPSPKAHAWKHFVAEGEHYLIVANESNSSRLYHWNGSEFVVRQAIDTAGATDWEFIQIDGETYLLALANYNNETGFHGNSNVYRLE